MTSGTRTSPSVVLVHGAWADASGWDGEIRRLQDDGYSVITPANPVRRSAHDAGHYGWEEKAEEYRSRIVDWVSGGYKRVAAG